MICSILKLRLLFYIAGIFSSIYCFLNSDQILGARSAIFAKIFCFSSRISTKFQVRLQTVFVDNNWLGFCIVAVRGLQSWFFKKYFFAQFYHKYFFVWANFFLISRAVESKQSVFLCGMDMLCFPARRADFCKAIDWRQAPRGECFLLCVQRLFRFFL